MKVKSSLATLQLVAAGLLLLGTGCETIEKHSLAYRLWDNEDLRKPRENREQLWKAPGTVLMLDWKARVVSAGSGRAPAILLKPRQPLLCPFSADRF